MGKGVQKEDVHSRINFLYQAAHVTLAQNPNNTELTRFYCYTLKSIAKKNVLRLDPSLKRNLCKKCCMLLIPGITSTVRHRSKRQPHTVVRCLECGIVKRFNTHDSYQLWSEQREAWHGTVPRSYKSQAGLDSGEFNGASQSCDNTPICAQQTNPGRQAKTKAEPVTVSKKNGCVSDNKVDFHNLQDATFHIDNDPCNGWQKTQIIEICQAKVSSNKCDNILVEEHLTRKPADQN